MRARAARRRGPLAPATRAPAAGGGIAELLDAQRQLRAGQADLAEQSCRRLLRRQPDHADAHNLLSVALGQLGRAADGERCSRRALRERPDEPGYLINLAERLRQQDRLEPAIATYRQALEGAPGHLGALDGLARALASLGRFEEALPPARRATLLAPENASGHALLGEILALLRQHDAAIAALGRAVELAPDRLDWWRNLGRICLSVGHVAMLERASRRLLEVDPGHAEAKVQLANALYRKGDYQGARELLESVPQDGLSGANALNLLGILLARQARIEDGLAAIDQAVALAPDAVELQNNALLHSNYDPSLCPAALSERHRAWAARFADPLTPDRAEFAQDRRADRPLRVGYVSPDFRRHSVAHFIAPLLTAHDPAAVEAVCYASVARPDVVTEELAAMAPAWRDVRHLDDDQLVAQIQADRIDILVDLAGHTLDGRLLVHARRPAPIQITHIGYPNTTGMRAIDYRITDPIADPDDLDDHYSETLIRLPRCFLCYAAPRGAPEVAPPPCLERGHVTFGSFNNLAKVNRQVVALWAEILCAVAGSRLLLKATGTGDPATQAHLREAFAACGIAADRLEIVPPEAAASDHLAIYHRVDIALDPFPYNGTTTTCEALWMGVPVITLAGDRHAGRVGASLLSSIGFAAGITATPEDYVLTARLLAGQPELLSAARRALRHDLGRSPLCDQAGYARAIEAAYRAVWQIWCAEAA